MELTYNSIEELKQVIETILTEENIEARDYVVVDGLQIRWYDIERKKVLLFMIEEGIPLDNFRKCLNECEKIKAKERKLNAVRYYDRGWIEMAKQVIPKSRWEEWEEYCVDICYDIHIRYEDDCYLSRKLPLINAIKIMISLGTTNEKNLDKYELLKVIREVLCPPNISNNEEFILMCSILEKFCPRYDEFKELINYDKITRTTPLTIEEIFLRAKSHI